MDSITEYHQPGRLHPSLVSRVYIGAPSHRLNLLSTWLISVLSPLRGQADTVTQSPDPKSHYCFLAGQTLLSKQIHSCQAWHSMDLEITSQKKANVRPLIGQGCILYYTIFKRSCLTSSMKCSFTTPDHVNPFFPAFTFY